MQPEVVHHIAEGIDIVLAATAHLILPGLQVIQHLRFVVELRIHGQRLHRHAHRVEESLVCAPVVDGGEQRLLFIIVFCQQEAVDRGEEIALEDTFLLAEGIHAGHIHAQSAHHTCLRVFRNLQVGHQLRVAVAAVKVLGIPLLAFLERCRLAQLGLCRCHFRHRQCLGFQRLAVVGFLQIGQHHLQRCSVADDVVDVEEEVEVLCILQQADMEQPVVVDVEGHDEVVESRQLFGEGFPLEI